MVLVSATLEVSDGKGVMKLETAAARLSQRVPGVMSVAMVTSISTPATATVAPNVSAWASQRVVGALVTIGNS